MRIGIFDSGLGGLLTAKYIKRLDPTLSLVYYGDTAHLPYGDKSPTTLASYVRYIVNFLKGQGVEGIVIACHTASAVAYTIAQEVAYPLPVWDAITPTVSYVQKLQAQKIGVIGTYTTVRSGIYTKALKGQVSALATPLLVPLIEEGWAEDPIMATVIEKYLASPLLQDIEVLILGCTHYPLIKKAIGNYFEAQKKPIQIVDTSYLLAQKVVAELKDTFRDPKAVDAFYVSDLQERFEVLAKRFWGASLSLLADPAYVDFV